MSFTRQRARGCQQRSAAARAGRGRRARTRARLPYGHLQHVQHPQERPAACATSSPARSRAPGRSRSASASRCPSATSRSTSRTPNLEGASHAQRSTRPLARAARGLRPRSSTRSAPVSSRTSASATCDYINRLIRVQRGLEVAGRGLLFVGFLPPAWIGGTAALSLSKILDNMEIGHNVMHGQYDWTGDERLNGKTLRVGHRLPRRPVAPLAQLHAPHPHEHRRQGPRHRLRHPAHVRG